MATGTGTPPDYGAVRSWARERPRTVTAVASAVGYALVLGVFGDLITIPTLDDATVVLLGDAIAAINATALTAILLGVAAIRRRQIRRHRALMLSAFGLILVFLVVYLTKIAGGFEKAIVIESGMFLASAAAAIYPAYLGMLAIHILLSAAAVPLVVHAVVLGLTHDPSELPDTVHPRVGRYAVWAWSTSLALGVVTYLLLNHVYAWEVAGLLVAPLV